MVTTEQQRTVVTYVERSAEVSGTPLSERRSRRYVGVHRALCRYVAQQPDDRALRERIKTIASEKPRWGVPRIVWRLHRDGWPDNHKRIERVYREEGLAVRRRSKKRVARPRVVKAAVEAPNERWSMDFVRDTLANGRVFRAFTLVDDCTRECPVIEVDASLSGERIARVLDRVAITRGLPTNIVCDNGPEFVSRALDERAHRRGVALLFIRAGHPVENCYIESFNGKLRDKRLNQHWFLSLADARMKIEIWRDEYNTARPPSGLAQLTPMEFARQMHGELASISTRLSA